MNEVTNNKQAKTVLSHAQEYLIDSRSEGFTFKGSQAEYASYVQACEILGQAKRRVELATLLEVRKQRSSPC